MLKWRVVLLSAILVVKAQQGYSRILIGTENTTMVNEADDLLNEEGIIFPENNQRQSETARVFSDVRKTGFSCADYEYPGYFADLETECQVFHICQIGGRKDSFPCPKGTIFNQEKLVCDWWYNSDCKKSREFYFINEVVASAMREVDQRLSRTKKSEQIPTRDYKAVQSSREIGIKDALPSMDQFFVREEETTRDYNEDLELVEETFTEIRLDLTQGENSFLDKKDASAKSLGP